MICFTPLVTHAGRQQGMSNGTAEDSDQDEPAVCAQGDLSAEQGLKHLLLTVDVERLYRSGSQGYKAYYPCLHMFLLMGHNRGQQVECNTCKHAQKLC